MNHQTQTVETATWKSIPVFGQRSSRLRLLVAATVFLLAPVLTRAATYTWSSLTTSTCTDGAGTWSTAQARWIATCGTTTPVNWAGNNTSAIIGSGGTPGAITLAGNPVIQDLTFNAVASSYYQFGSSTLRVGGGNANTTSTFTVNPGVTADFGKGGTSGMTIAQGAGNNGLTCDGGGTFLLSGTAQNTYSGATTIQGNTSVYIGAMLLGTSSSTVNLTSGTLGAFNSTARTLANPVNLKGNFTLGGTTASTHNGNLTFGTGAWTLTGGTWTLTVNTIAATINSAIGQDASSRGLALSSLNGGTLSLGLAGTEGYTGATTINSGTLALGASCNLNAASGVVIAAGGTFDVSAQATWTAGASASPAITASGTATAATIKGGTTVALGSRPITLNWDGSHDTMLTISQGALTLGGNLITLNGSSTLAHGLHNIIAVTGGSIMLGTTPTFAGTAIASGDNIASVTTAGGNLTIDVESAPSAYKIEVAGSGSATTTAGSSVNLTITALDGAGATLTSFSQDKALSLYGLASSPNSTASTISDKTGAARAITATVGAANATLTFASGVASVSGANNGVLLAYNGTGSAVTLHCSDGTATSASGTGAAGLALTVNAGASTKLAIITTAFSAAAGTTSPTITAQRQDPYGNPNTTEANLPVYLSTTSGTGIFRDPADTSTITSVTVNNGSSMASFKYNDSTIGTPALQAADQASGPDTGLTDATQVETITAQLQTWSGTPASFQWNTSDVNWVGGSGIYTDGNLVTFDDNGSDASPIDLVGTWSPGSVTVNTSTKNYTFMSSGSGKISGAATTLSKSGTTKLTLATANDYAGATTVSLGTIAVQNNTALGTAAGATKVAAGVVVEVSGGLTGVAEPITLAGSGVASGGAIRNTSGNNTWTGAVTLGSAAQINSDAGTLTLASGGISGPAQNLTMGGSGNVTVSGVIATTTGTLTKNNNGLLTLSGNNTYSGLTTINSGGAIEAQHVNALGGTGNGTVVNSGGALRVSGGLAPMAAEPLTLSGTGVSADGALRNVSGDNTLPGAITLGADTRINSDAGTLTLNNANTIAGAFGLTFGGAGNTTVSGATIPLASITSLLMDGSGTLTLGAGSTFTGKTTINAGTVTIAADTALGANPAATVTDQITLNGGTLHVTTGFTMGSKRGLTIGTSGGTIDVDSGQTLVYGVTGIAGTGRLTKNGGGTLKAGTTSNSDTFGGVTLNNGFMQFGHTTGLGATAANTLIVNGGTLQTYDATSRSPSVNVQLNGDLGVGSTSTGPITLNAAWTITGGSHTITVNQITFTAGAIADGGNNYGITKAGATTLVFSGANTYGGPTVVSAGTLTISGDSSGLSGGTTVSSLATLGGTGKLGGNVTYQTGALASFSSLTPMTFSGNVTFNNTAVSVNLPVSNLGNGTYTLATCANAIGGTVNATPTYASGNVAAGATGTVSISGNSLILTVTGAPAAQTYTWSGGSSAAWNVAASWTPTRTTPASTDILLFNSGGTVAATAVPAEGIAQLLVSGSTTVNLTAGTAANTLTIMGDSGTDLSVAAGSQLNVVTTAENLSLMPGATAVIAGSMTFSTAATTLTAPDASAITFQNGSIFTADTSSTGSPFGTANLNSVVFASGSTFVQKGGANPFGASAPASVVVFQNGSLYSVQANLAPSFSGRTFANVEINSASFNQTGTGASALSLNNLTVTAGSLTLGMTGGFNLKGNVSVASGATLIFNPASAATLSLNGTALQSIGNAGTLTFAANCGVIVDNPAGVQLGNDISVAGPLTVTATGVLDLNSHQLTVASAPSLAGALTMEVTRTGANTFTGSKLTQTAGTLAYGGALAVSVVSGTVQTGESIPLFVSAGGFGGGFGSVTGPTAAGLTRNISQLTGGTGGNITFTCDGTLAANAAADTAICAGDSYPLGGAGAGGSGSYPAYAWTSTPPGFTSALADPSVSPAVNTVYHLTVTDSVGCTATKDVAVTINPLPATSGITGTNSVQQLTSAAYSVVNTPGSTYGWTVPAGASFTGATGNSINVTFGSTSGNVSVIETNATGCTGTPQSLAVTVITCTAPAITGGIEASATNVCVGSPVILTLTNATGTAPLTFQWQTNDVAILNATNASYTNLSVTLADTGNYACVVGNGCGSITSAVVVLTVNAFPVISTTSLPNGTYDSPYSQTVANTGATGVTATGLPAGLSIANSGWITGTPAASGTFSVTVTATNATGCSAGTSLSLTVDKAVTAATLSVNNSPLTYNGSGQSATVSVTSSNTPGGVANLLTGGAPTQTASGTYAVTADYVPANTNYTTLIGLSAGSLVINQATPIITLAPTASAIAYGQTLASSTLSGGTVTPPGGTFAFTTPATKPGMGTASHAVTYTPPDLVNYLAASTSVNVTVNQVTPGLQDIVVLGGSAIITFTNGVAGASYVSEFTADLSGNIWTAFITNTLAANGSWTVTNAIAGEDQRFYRTVIP